MSNEYAEMLTKTQYAHRHLISSALKNKNIRVVPRSKDVFNLQVRIGNVWMTIENMDFNQLKINKNKGINDEQRMRNQQVEEEIHSTENILPFKPLD